MTFPIFGTTIAVCLIIGIVVLTMLFIDNENYFNGVKRDGIIFGAAMLSLGILGLLIKLFLCFRSSKNIQLSDNI